jgi:hypothetical protein
MSRSKWLNKVKSKEIFGKWTVLDATVVSVLTKKYNHPCVLVKCECGTEKYVQVAHLVGGASTGCRRCTRRPNLENHHSWKGSGKVSQRYFWRLERQAKQRNIPFNLTIQQLSDLFEKQSGICALTGRKLIFGYSRKFITDTTASIDRIDSKKPYEIENVRWVHKTINKIKNNLSDDEFISICKEVVENGFTKLLS